MAGAKKEDPSAFARAVKRRQRAMREVLASGSAPAGDTDGHLERQVVIWRVAGDPHHRARAGWRDAVALGAPPRKAAPWSFLLSSIAGHNRFLSLSFWSRRK